MPHSQMLSRAATRTTTSLVTRRGFHATRARLSSPYHYPEGPYTNIPFNPRSKWFGVGFWGFVATGFFAPFGIAGACFSLCRPREGALFLPCLLFPLSLAGPRAGHDTDQFAYSLPDQQGGLRWLIGDLAGERWMDWTSVLRVPSSEQLPRQSIPFVDTLGRTTDEMREFPP